MSFLGRLQIDRKLTASVVLNFICRIPSIAALFLVLPIIRRDLGVDLYGDWLAALALGGLLCFPFGGVCAAGRRVLGAAIARNDPGAEAEAVVSLLLCVGAVAAILAAGFWAAGSWLPPSAAPGIRLIVLIALASGAANVMDHLRAAYNEHFITALAQGAIQLLVLLCVLYFRAPLHSPALAALAVQGPYLFGSLITGALLFGRRPDLLRAAPRQALRILKTSWSVSISEGLMGSLPNLLVLWLRAVGGAPAAAWFGTMARFYATALTPALLLLFPIGAFLSSRWSAAEAATRTRILRIASIGSVAYGVVGGGLAAIAGALFAQDVVKTGAMPPVMGLAGVCALFASLLAQRCYGFIIYSVADAGRFAMASALRTGAALVLAVGIGHFLPWRDGLNLLQFCVCAILLLGILMDSRARLHFAQLETPG